MVRTTEVISCKAGRFVGRILDSGVRVFRGIPYAEPPVGDRRWKPPVEKAYIDQVYEAFDSGDAPVQMAYEPDRHINGFQLKSCSEDCLHLNIWTADTSSPAKPVVIWIYGGNYLEGYAGAPVYDGEKLIREHPEIVLVTVDYRLGVLASLNLSSLDPEGEYRYSNNLDILDQRMAMKWVRENIAAFGGDPDNVTLWGYSAGSNAISHHITSAGSRPYFHKAICESSFYSAFGTTSLATSKIRGDAFISLAGASSIKDLLDLSPADILALQEKLIVHPFPGIYTKMLAPVSDGLVLPLDPYAEIRGGAARDKKVLIGTVAGEYDQMFKDLPSDDEVFDAVLNAIRPEIRPDREWAEEFVSGVPGRTRRIGAMDLYNDMFLRVPGITFAEDFSRTGECYMFYSQWWEDEQGRRTPHGAHHQFVFGNRLWAEPPEDLRKRIQDTWVRFIVKGDPNGAGIPEWPRYDAERRATMIIDKEWRVEDDPRSADRVKMTPIVRKYNG